MNAAELSPRRRRRRFLVGYDEGDVTVKREPADEDIKVRFFMWDLIFFIYFVLRLFLVGCRGRFSLCIDSMI